MQETYALSMRSIPDIDIDESLISEQFSKNFTNADKNKPVTYNVNVSGAAECRVVFYYDLKLFAKNYLKAEFVVSVDADLAASLTYKDGYTTADKDNFKFKIVDLNFPIPMTAGALAISAELKLIFEWQVEAFVSLDMNFYKTIGFKYVLEGFESDFNTINDQKFEHDASAEGKFSAKAGIEASANLELLGDLWKVSMPFYVGLQLDSVAEGTILDAINGVEYTGNSFHACDLCLNGAIYFDARGSVKSTYNVLDLLKDTIIDDDLFDPVHKKLINFYLSILNDSHSVHSGKVKFDTGVCPNKAWKVTLTAKDKENIPTNRLISISYKNEPNTEIESGNSVFSTYLHNGIYIADVTFETETIEKIFTVNNAAINVTINEKQSASGGNSGTGGNEGTGNEGSGGGDNTGSGDGESGNNIIASGYCGGEGDGTNLTWTLDSAGTLTISGSGIMADYSYSTVAPRPWESYMNSIKTLIVQNGVTSIGKMAFYFDNINHSNLEKMELSENLVTIGYRAFYNCSKLNDFNLPKNLAFLGEYAFQNCSSITELYIPETLTEIRPFTFSGCSGLTSVVIPEGVEEIGNNAFSKCINLEHVVLPESLIRVSASWELSDRPGAFYGCPKLTSSGPIGGDYDIQYKWTTSIPHGAFFDDDNINSIVIKEGISTIGIHALATGSLSRVIIPASVTSIERNGIIQAYSNPIVCEIYFKGNAPEVIAAEDEDRSFSENAILYYTPGTTGWTDSEAYDAENCTWNGYKIEIWDGTDIDNSTNGSSSVEKIKVGDFLTFGTFSEHPLLWQVVDVENGKLKLFCSDLLFTGPIDANMNMQVVSSSMSSTRIEGNSNWHTSDIRQYLNSNSLNVSYKDVLPNYASLPGFLTNFSADEVAIILDTTHKSQVHYNTDDSEVEGGQYAGNLDFFESDYTEESFDSIKYTTTTEKIFLPDIVDLKEMEKRKVDINLLCVYDKYSDSFVESEQRPGYFTRTPLYEEINSLSKAVYFGIYYMHTLFGSSTAESENGIRPMCHIQPALGQKLLGSGTLESPYVLDFSK